MGLPPLLCRSISTRNSLSDLALPPPLPPPRISCAPLGSKGLLLRRFSNVSRRQPRFISSALFLAPSPLFFRGLRTLRDQTGTPPHPSIGEFQFISWFLSHASISSEKDIRHFRGFEISITRCLDPAAPSEIVCLKENFIFSFPYL